MDDRKIETEDGMIFTPMPPLVAANAKSMKLWKVLSEPDKRVVYEIVGKTPRRWTAYVDAIMALRRESVADPQKYAAVITILEIVGRHFVYLPAQSGLKKVP